MWQAQVRRGWGNWQIGRKMDKQSCELEGNGAEAKLSIGPKVVVTAKGVW